jgi:putative endonuclease
MTLRESRDERSKFFVINTYHFVYFVYLLEHENDLSCYTGLTNNIKKRVRYHQSGNGCRTTALKQGLKLIYFECYPNRKDALSCEKFLKGGSGRKYLKKAAKKPISMK